MAHPHLLHTEESPPPGPPPPPSAAFCDRVYAKDQLPNLQAAFTEFYPNGLPNVYKMLQTPGAEGVPQTYLEDYLPIGFYTQPRPHATAIFSTHKGERPFRQMQHLLPQRRIHLWSRDEIQSVCNSLRKLYWDHMKAMHQPFCWDSLWDYFDAFDLYHYGALNLWNVVNQLFDENKTIYTDVIKEFAVHIGHWADGWLANMSNKTKLMAWDETQGPLLRIITPEDWTDIGDIPDDAVPMLANALKHRRALQLSPDGSIQDAKPAHLASACLRNSLENWLAGQRIFTPTGLPSPPQVRSHHCSPASKAAPAPVTIHNGNHYYLPTGRATSAVEKLQQSSVAAGPVIAHGSNKTIAPRPTRGASSDTSSHTLQVSPETRSKSTEPRSNYTLPPVVNSADKSGAQDDDSHPGENEDDEYSDFDALTPTKIRRRGRGNPRSAQGASKSTVTASLPASVIMGFSELSRPSEPANAPAKENQTPRSNKNKDAESLSSHGKDQKKGQRSNKSGARSANHDLAGTRTSFSGHSQRGGSGSHSVTGANGKPGYQASARMIHPQGPSGFPFHPAAVGVAHSHQRTYSGLQQHPDAATAVEYRHQAPQHPVSHNGFTAHGGRGNSVSSRFEQNENQWPHQHRPENLSAVPVTPNRGGLYRGGLRRGGNRRGSNNQRNVTAPAIQYPADIGLNHKRRDGTPWTNQQWRRQVPNLAQGACRNRGCLDNEYVPCSCEMCDTRNRSVLVKVERGQDRAGFDLVMRIKIGLGTRYGFVEEVYPVPGKDPVYFIARFRDEQSVGQALTIGGGHMPDKGITVTITPTVKSKWMSAIPPQPPMGLGFPSHPSYPPLALEHPGTFAGSHALPAPIYSVASNMQIMPLEFVPQEFVPPTFPGHDTPQFASRGPSAFIRPPFVEQPHMGPQPPIRPQRFPHQEQRLVSTPLETAALAGSAAVGLEKGNVPANETLQSKPPSEEALGETGDVDQDGVASPQSNTSKASEVKARVSLPNTPPKPAQNPQAQLIVQTPPQPPAEVIAREMEKQPSNNAKVRTESETQAAVETALQPESPTVPEEKSPVQHARVPSIFTEDQIKERRQAWAKISMPLNPRKSKPTSPTRNHTPVLKDGGLQVSQCDRLEATKTNESNMSSPTQLQTCAPEIGSVSEPSRSETSDEITQCREKEDHPETPLDQATGSEAALSGRPSEPHTQPPQAKHADTSSAEEAIKKGKQLKSGRVAAIQEPGQGYTSSRDSASSTPTKGSTTKFLQKGGGYPSNSMRSDNQPDLSTDNQTKKKAKKPKKKGKGKQYGDSQMAMSRPPLPQAWTPSMNQGYDMTGFHATHVTDGPMQSMTETVPPTHHGGQVSGSPSAKRHHEDGNPPANPGSTKHTKKYDSNMGSAHDNQVPPPWAFDESDSPDEGVRGRKGFREGRGGSLRMGKQRRPRALMPQPMLTEQPVDNEASSSPSDLVLGSPKFSVPNSPSSLMNGAKTGTKSRLNPKAQEFVSPSRPAGDRKPNSGKSSPLKDLSTKSQENSSGNRAGSSAGDSKPSETGAGNHGALLRGASQLGLKHHRAVSEGTKKENRNNEGGAHGDGKKGSAKGKKAGKGKDRAVTSGGAGTKQDKKQAAPQTPERKEGKDKKPGLVAANDDWPSLPGPRDRALSKPQTPSVWSAKKKGTSLGEESGPAQGSPPKKD